MIKQVDRRESKREYLARQSNEQLEIYVMNADMQEDILRERLLILSGCGNFGGQDGTDGACHMCIHENRTLFERCCLFQDSVRDWRKKQKGFFYFRQQ